jgi:hypothetical protein
VRSGAAAKLLINDVSGAINAARKVWASFPGAGYGQGERSMSSLTKVFAQSLAVGGSAVSSTNPVPVAIVNNTPDRYASYGNYYGAYGRGKKTQYSVGVSFDPNSLTLAEGVKAVLPEVHDFKMSMDDLLAPLRETAASANLFSGAMGQFTAVSMEELGGLPPLAAGIAAFGNTARTEFALTNDVMKQNQAELIKSISVTQQLSGMIAQASGFLPQQQVGKKRGLFSKILGFAAPFLSFIPGVGPILSQIAGIASNAVGAIGLAWLLASQGAFNRVESSPAHTAAAALVPRVRARWGSAPAVVQ